MDAKLFVDGYPFRMTPEQIHAQAYSSLIEDAQDWSYSFGLFLHERLRGEQSKELPQARCEEYSKWAEKTLPTMVRTLADAPLDDALRARNELNFHVLNRHMINMWLPIANGDWNSNTERLQCLNASQDNVALEGLGHYALRQQVVDTYGSHVLYDSPESRSATGTQVGTLQEIDAAIVLLDVARRHPNLTVVPSPLQFERRWKQRNIDFTVVDFVASKAIGVQVKTRVTEEDYKNADEDRVVFIDGTVDLGNVRAVRTFKGKSTERIVPWPGIIAAKRVDTIKTHGRYTGHLTGRAHQVMRQKIIARQKVGNIKVDYQDLSQKIGERILRKL